jgi:hypothetical protein
MTCLPGCGRTIPAPGVLGMSFISLIAYLDPGDDGLPFVAIVGIVIAAILLTALM